MASVPSPPSGDSQYITEAAKGTGLPTSLVQAQAYDESSYKTNATSSAGAEGFWQFMPSTYNAIAPAAGVPENTETNIADETKVYVAYMNQLLQQEGGSVFRALEAYNAGPANLSAGSDYATKIMSQAKVSQSATANGGTQSATLDSSIFGKLGSIFGDVTNPAGAAENAVESQFGDMFAAIFSGLGITSFKDLLQRLALILFGVVLIIVGIVMFTRGGGSPVSVNSTENADETTGKTTSSRTVNSPVGRSTRTRTSSLGAGKAIEAAASA